MSQVRFQVLFGPSAPRSWPAGTPATADFPPPDPDSGWYVWRLIGANNRELGRSAPSFVSYDVARRAAGQLKRNIERLVEHVTTDPATGRWGWLLELDGVAVAVSGRWYERELHARLGAAKFFSLAPGAELADGVVTLPSRHERRAVASLAGGAQ
jgi:hypothetical protein